MPSPVLADSEDDGDNSSADEIALDPRASAETKAHPSSARGNQHNDPAATNLAMSFDGACDDGGQSTGSTARLQRQIQSAERGLLAFSPSNAKAITVAAVTGRSSSSSGNVALADSSAASASPTVLASKKQRRRHTAAVTGAQDGVVLEDNSSLGPGLGLPRNSLGPAFAHHEPNVLFRDSGSTVAENEASQQRLVERALVEKRKKKLRGSTSAVSLRDLEPVDSPGRSSSFPWSAEDTGGALAGSGKRRDRGGGVDDAEYAGGGDVAAGQVDDGTPADSYKYSRPSKPMTERPSLNGLCEEDTGNLISSPTSHLTAHHITSAAIKPSSSPIVRIPALRASNLSSTHQAPISPDGPPISRKRKSQQLDTDPLNSDDLAIGLPKERYKPRPSRRRATQIEEAVIDYSVRPERAAKIRRTKTAAAAVGAMAGMDGLVGTAVQEGKGDVVKSGHRGEGPVMVVAAPANEEACETDGEQQHSVQAADVMNEGTDVERQSDMPKRLNPENNKQDSPTKSQQQEDEISVKPAQKTKQPADNDEIFIKPTPKAKASSKKAKRSHTTIFEDHVDFTNTAQHTPSLSQQQAKRKSALVADVRVDPPRHAHLRKRRKVVHDEDDDEGEDEEGEEGAGLAGTRMPGSGSVKHANLGDEDDDAEAVIDVQPSKKRGGDLPAATSTSSKFKSPETVCEDSDEDADKDDHATQAAKPPKKAGRGRPRKNSMATQRAAEDSRKDHERAVDPSAEPPLEQEQDQGIVRPTTTTISPPIPRAKGTQGPTPSPDPPAPGPAESTNNKGTKDVIINAPASTPQQFAPVKGSPTSHSPIKSSSAVPLRVGLSRRHRIQPLLRSVRPVLKS